MKKAVLGFLLVTIVLSSVAVACPESWNLWCDATCDVFWRWCVDGSGACTMLWEYDTCLSTTSTACCDWQPGL
jgi:hypothetical protein